MKYRIHNLITGNRYEFSDADLGTETLEQRLARKANAYGKGAWTETIPAWTQTGVWSTDEPPVFDPEAVIEHPEQIIEHAAEYTVEVIDTSADDQAARIATAWAAANAHAESGMDTNSRSSLLWMAMDPACPPWRMERILAVQAWWAAIWSHYGAVKQQIGAGMDVPYDPAVAGPCPWTIWQILSPLE